MTKVVLFRGVSQSVTVTLYLVPAGTLSSADVGAPEQSKAKAACFWPVAVLATWTVRMPSASLTVQMSIGAPLPLVPTVQLREASLDGSPPPVSVIVVTTPT